ncbi:MAG: hypothetical protein ACJ796_14520 [Gemmatimonadaceae bacterium]
MRTLLVGVLFTSLLGGDASAQRRLRVLGTLVGKHNVTVRESFLIISALERPFNESDPYALIPSYERVNEEGRAISDGYFPSLIFLNSQRTDLTEGRNRCVIRPDTAMHGTFDHQAMTLWTSYGETPPRLPSTLDTRRVSIL